MGKPIDVLRDGPIKAAIWRNEARSVFYTVSIARSYRDRNGDWKERASFTQEEVPRVVTLLQEAESRMREYSGLGVADSGRT